MFSESDVNSLQKRIDMVNLQFLKDGGSLDEWREYIQKVLMPKHGLGQYANNAHWTNFTSFGSAMCSSCGKYSTYENGGYETCPHCGEEMKSYSWAFDRAIEKEKDAIATESLSLLGV